MEKNLWRQGSQRNEGKPSRRPRKALAPGTCSGAIFCSSGLPHRPQCA